MQLHLESVNVCKNIHKDEDSQFGPPDKRGHFWGKEKHLQIGHRVEVKNDDNVWYTGTLTEFNATTRKWVAVFHSDGEKTLISFPDENVCLL